MAQVYDTPDEELLSTHKWILLSFGTLFIILPVIANLIQLHHEIQEWMRNTYSQHTVQPWIQSHLRFLYMLSILCGSAFAAVNICNSNLFHLSIFNMGLNKRQKATFKNERLLSNVILENIPQLILQMIFLILTVGSSISSITLIAMIFSIISMLSTIFDYQSSSLFFKCESITVIEMSIESKQLANTQHKKFDRIIVHHRNPICHELAKIICVDRRLIEIILSIQTTTGAKLIFYIRNNDSRDEKLGATIVTAIRNAIDSGQLTQVMLVSLVLTIVCFFYFTGLIF